MILSDKEKYIIDQTPVTFKELIKASKKRSIFSKYIAPPNKITSDLLVDEHKKKQLMILSKEKKYIIDQMSVTPMELIREAKRVAKALALSSTFITCTNQAAEILREYGHNVSENPEVNEG